MLDFLTVLLGATTFGFSCGYALWKRSTLGWLIAGVALGLVLNGLRVGLAGVVVLVLASVALSAWVVRHLARRPS